MGQRNQQKRAAKKRRKQRQGSPPPRGGGGGAAGRQAPHGPHGPDCTCGHTDAFGGFGGDTSGVAAPSAEALAQVMVLAAQEHAKGDHTAAQSCASELSQSLAPRHDRTLATAAGLAMARLLAALWRAGWLPVDAWELAGRRTDALATDLLVDAIAADVAQHAPATVHDRWTEQLGWIEATVWWKKSEPHLGQWAQRHGVDIEVALLVTITLMAELVDVPVLPQIVPLPGTAPRRTTAEAAGVDQKVLGRVRGLLAKAESTQFPDEAEALSAKAQELMNRYAFERALLDADDHKKQTATSVRLWLDSPYLEAKSHLVAAIADANRCRSVFYSQLGFVALVGEAIDLEITELLSTSLLVQATRAMVAEGRHVTGTGTSRTRSFRQSFLVSYAARIGERLTDASSRARDAADDARLLPVLAARSRVVEDTFNEMFQHTVEKAISVSNGAGWNAGRAAADRADLTIERREVRE